MIELLVMEKSMNLKLGLCYRITRSNGEHLEFKFLGDKNGYPEGQLADGSVINLLNAGKFKDVLEIECPF